MILKEWEPTKKQALLLGLPFDILEAFYGGTIGSGKSDVLLIYPLVHGFHEDPGFKGLYLRRTFPELKNEIIPRSTTHFNFKKLFGASYNKNDHVWEFPSGSLYFFGHCENEDDIHNYDTMQPNYVAFDELTSFTEWQYLYITLERVRKTKYSSLPAIVRAAGMPGNIGHNWVNRRFIKPNKKGMVVLQGKSGIKRIFIPASIDDNPHIDENYRKSLEALPEAEKQAKLYGNWDAFQGQVFEEFRDRKYPDEPSNALHIIEPFDIPSWWPKIVSIDWGFAPPAMTYVSYGAISPNQQVIIYREQWWQKTKIQEWAGYVKEFIDIESPKVIKMCKSAGQDRGQEHTILQQVEAALEHSVELSDNKSGSRIAGKVLLHEYFRWKQKYVPNQFISPYSESHADWLLRNKGLIEYRRYLEQFNTTEPEMNLPKLLIFNTCPKLIEAIKACIYDKTNPEDIAEFEGDDPIDTLRYLVDIADKYFGNAKGEFEKLQEQEKLVKEFEETHDWNRLFHQARVLESQNKIEAIRRYHH